MNEQDEKTTVTCSVKIILEVKVNPFRITIESPLRKTVTKAR